MALSPPEKKSAFQRHLPIVDWLPKYDWGGHCCVGASVGLGVRLIE